MAEDATATVNNAMDSAASESASDAADSAAAQMQSAKDAAEARQERLLSGTSFDCYESTDPGGASSAAVPLSAFRLRRALRGWATRLPYPPDESR